MLWPNQSSFSDPELCFVGLVGTVAACRATQIFWGVCPRHQPPTCRDLSPLGWLRLNRNLWVGLVVGRPSPFLCFQRCRYFRPNFSFMANFFPQVSSWVWVGVGPRQDSCTALCFVPNVACASLGAAGREAAARAGVFKGGAREVGGVG